MYFSLPPILSIPYLLIFMFVLFLKTKVKLNSPQIKQSKTQKDKNTNCNNTHRETDRQTQTQIQTQTAKAGRQTDRQTHTQTHTHTHTQTHTRRGLLVLANYSEHEACPRIQLINPVPRH